MQERDLWYCQLDALFRLLQSGAGNALDLSRLRQ
jgi:hypothetical protein